MLCPKCNVTLPDNAISCPRCGHRWGQPHQYYGDGTTDVAVNFLLLPTKAIWQAVLASALGHLSVFLIPAPFAVLFGILALIRISKLEKNGADTQLIGKGRAIYAIAIGTICLLLWMTIILVLAFANSGNL